jgi:hypothetical protein|tara:strand:+ start:623 stop:1222 length:600 start_codon:yes stop_codon:yes gene_type:complete
MKDLDATYDPTKNPFTPIEPGFYPAHVTGFGTREVKTKVGDAIVVNMTYEVAEEAGKLVQILYEMEGYNYKLDDNGDRVPVLNGDGKSKTTQCKHLVGKKFRDNGTFVFTGSESSGRNRRYFDLLSTLGVDLKEDSNGEFPLSLLEEEDVIGVPVLAKLGSEEYEKDGEKRTAWKVFNVQQWNDGQRLSKEEIEDDLPF